MAHCHRFLNPPLTRREMLQRCANGFGAIAFAALASSRAMAATGLWSPVTPRARRVIFLYMDGGPSQMDTFDPKPRLNAEHGKPFALKMEPTQFNDNGSTLGCPWPFLPGGESGLPVSDLFPRVRECADDLCVVRSIVARVLRAHERELFPAHRPRPAGPAEHGRLDRIRPRHRDRRSAGFRRAEWRADPARRGVDNFDSGFLPAAYQGSIFRPGATPVANIVPREPSAQMQREKLDLVQGLDRLAHAARPADAVEAAIANHELAFRMQAAVPELTELRGESPTTLQLYGLDAAFEPTRIFGRQCLLARRLVERGVRFVELTCPAVGDDRWDQHSNLDEGHENNARAVDQPIAALLADLKARGLLDATIVLWAGEFGRTPFAQGDNGRDHNPFGFSMWLAGGGFRGGTVYGATDEYGYKVVSQRVEMHDLHATILHLLGIDHKRLTYRFGGRDMRLTDVHGEVVQELLA